MHPTIGIGNIHTFEYFTHRISTSKHGFKTLNDMLNDGWEIHHNSNLNEDGFQIFILRRIKRDDQKSTS